MAPTPKKLAAILADEGLRVAGASTPFEKSLEQGLTYWMAQLCGKVYVRGDGDKVAISVNDPKWFYELEPYVAEAKRQGLKVRGDEYFDEEYGEWKAFFDSELDYDVGIAQMAIADKVYRDKLAKFFGVKANALEEFNWHQGTSDSGWTAFPARLLAHGLS